MKIRLIRKAEREISKLIDFDMLFSEIWALLGASKSCFGEGIPYLRWSKPGDFGEKRVLFDPKSVITRRFVKEKIISFDRFAFLLA